MAAFGGKIERGGAGEIAGIDRSAVRQKQVNHPEMTYSRGVAEGPGAKPITRVDRCAVVEQVGCEIEAILVDGGKQRQRHFDRTDLRFDRFKAKPDIPARLGFRGARDGGCAQRDNNRT